MKHCCQNFQSLKNPRPEKQLSINRKISLLDSQKPTETDHDEVLISREIRNLGKLQSFGTGESIKILI